MNRRVLIDRSIRLPDTTEFSIELVKFNSDTYMAYVRIDNEIVRATDLCHCPADAVWELYKAVDAELRNRPDYDKLINQLFW